MKRFVIEDLSEVAEAMYDEIVNEGKDDVLFVGFYEDAIEVVKELLMYEDVIPYNIEISPIEINGYTKEYYVSLNDDLEVWCEPAWYEEKEFYLMTDTDITFIADDCNSSIIKTIFTEEAVEVSFDYYEEYCDECCGECICHGGCNEDSEDSEETKESNELSDKSVMTRVVVDDNGHVCGFEKTWSTEDDGLYFYNQVKHYSNNEEVLRRMMKDFDINFK